MQTYIHHTGIFLTTLFLFRVLKNGYLQWQLLTNFLYDRQTLETLLYQTKKLKYMVDIFSITLDEGRTHLYL